VRNAIQPGRKLRFALKARDGLKRTEKRFLQNIFGGGRVTHELERQIVDIRRMFADTDCASFFVSLPQTLHKIRIVGQLYLL
jgi:hypothetical protein